MRDSALQEGPRESLDAKEEIPSRPEGLLSCITAKSHDNSMDRCIAKRRKSSTDRRAALLVIHQIYDASRRNDEHDHLNLTDA